MNRMIGPIWLGVILGSLVIVYLGLGIATPQIPQQVQSVEATLVSQVKTNLEQPVPLVQKAAAENPSDCLLHASFPGSVRQWCSWIQSNAAAQQVDPNLVAAVMTQESGGDPTAYSGSGAVGLLQVMPSDGIAASFYCVSGPCFASRPRTQQLLDPQFNISYGTRMLAGLVNRYGNVREALRAYGPMDVGYSYADTVLAIYTQN
jgi:soluble lytic murein transglycosylase-like protein